MSEKQTLDDHRQKGHLNKGHRRTTFQLAGLPVSTREGWSPPGSMWEACGLPMPHSYQQSLVQEDAHWPNQAKETLQGRKCLFEAG